MKSSIDDPEGMKALGLQIGQTDIFLNGKRVDLCTAFDTEEGWIERRARPGTHEVVRETGAVIVRQKGG